MIDHPRGAERVVVVLVPGISEDRVVAAMEEGRAPHLASLVSTGLVAEVDISGTISGLTFWTRALAGAEPAQNRLAIGGAQPPIWSALGARAAVVGVPDGLFPDPAGRGGPATAGADSAFVGSNAMTPVEGDELRAARLPAQFAVAGEKLKLIASTLAPGRWSDWIELGEGGAERFQVLRYDSDRYLLSPLYRAVRLETIPPSQVVLSDPFVAAVEPYLRTAVVEHLVSVDETRGLAIERLLQSSADLRAFFYAFTVGESATRVFGGEVDDSSMHARVVEVLDRRLERLSAAAGDGGVLLLVGGPGLSRQKSGAAWCLVSSGEGARLERSRVDVGGLVRLLRYLLGVPLSVKDREGVPPALLARYPHRASVVADTPRDVDRVDTFPWGVDSLESLLQAPGS
ncbi:MAG: hypothetical protein HY899_12875 [Deltaproteobacteria bacterium]|nr:hypothetical protein [Deltaproteobacteria bacterium]